MCRCGLCEKGHHNVSRTNSTACEKWSIRLADVRTRGHAVDGFQAAGSSLKGPSTRLSQPGPPVRLLEEKELGAVGELSNSNPGTEVPGVRQEMPNVSARGADDVDMGDEVAQRSVSDAESVEGDEVREPRRRNSPSDPTSREIEDHVLPAPKSHAKPEKTEERREHPLSVLREALAATVVQTAKVDPAIFSTGQSARDPEQQRRSPAAAKVNTAADVQQNLQESHEKNHCNKAKQQQGFHDGASARPAVLWPC